MHENLQRLIAEYYRFAGFFLEDGLDKLAFVLAFAQRWQAYFYAVEAVVQVFPELTLGNQIGQIPVAGADQLNVYIDRSVSTERGNLALIKHA